jgi:hypothetical protein
VGSKVIFEIFRVRVGCRFRFLRHVEAHVPFHARVFKGKSFLFTITLPLFFYRRHCVFFLAPLFALVLYSHERFLVYAIQAPLAAHSNG